MGFMKTRLKIKYVFSRSLHLVVGLYRALLCSYFFVVCHRQWKQNSGCERESKKKWRNIFILKSVFVANFWLLNHQYRLTAVTLVKIFVYKCVLGGFIHVECVTICVQLVHVFIIIFWSTFWIQTISMLNRST